MVYRVCKTKRRREKEHAVDLQQCLLKACPDLEVEFQG